MPSSSGTVTVKLCGDGAQFSRTSQFVLLSFSLPDNSDDALSSYGNLLPAQPHVYTIHDYFYVFAIRKLHLCSY